MKTLILALLMAGTLSASGYCIPQDKHCGHPKYPLSVVVHLLAAIW